MKKIIVSFFIIVTALYSASSESKIIKLIFDSLYGGDVSIYTKDSKKVDIINEAGFKLVDSCSQADIVYSSKKLKGCNNKPLFTDNFKVFSKNKNAIGAFYWKKGRPNILFLKPRLDKFNLTLPLKLKKYEMQEL